MKSYLISALIAALVAGGMVFATQDSMWSGSSIRQDNDPYQERNRSFRRRRSRYSDPRRGVPDWENDQQFKKDVFTFCRIEYTSYGRGWSWDTDYPDADLNFSYRLQELTSLKVNPDGIVLRLTDPELFDYPFIYFSEPGGGNDGYGGPGMVFSDEEVIALRNYLYRGGFMMADDFWGEGEWNNFYREMKRVFPNREPQDLPQDHEIFHMVYDIDNMPMIPDVQAYRRGRLASRPGVTEAHYRGIFDDKGRLMCMICHNTDLGDGWEREGEDRGYFREYSEPYAYPLGINIITYALTH